MLFQGSGVQPSQSGTHRIPDASLPGSSGYFRIRLIHRAAFAWA
jgi:hypothetical protein